MTDATEFKCGDFVKLKSGGPTMMVSDTYDRTNLRCACIWQDALGQPHAETYPAEFLERAERGIQFRISVFTQALARWPEALEK